VLLVDQDPVVRTAVAAHLREAGFPVIEAVNLGEALTLLRARRPIGVVFGTLKPAAVAAIRREFPRVKLLLGQDGAAPVSLHGLPSIRRPYDLREVELATRALMRHAKVGR
jgi:CheY-like chemotaxis protein